MAPPMRNAATTSHTVVFPYPTRTESTGRVLVAAKVVRPMKTTGAMGKGRSRKPAMVAANTANTCQASVFKP